MKIKRIKKTKAGKVALEKYDKPVSLYPLKPEDALKAFMQVDRTKVED